MARATVRKRRCSLALLGTALAGLALVGFIIAPAFAVGEPTVRLNEAFSTAGSGYEESSIGDLVVDAMRSAVGAQVALLDAEALQSLDLPKGVVKVSRFQSALSDAHDPVVTLTVPGKVLAQALDRSVSSVPQPNPGFLQVSGITFDVNTAGAGHLAAGIRVNGKPLDMTAAYTVAVPQSLALGANGYFLVWPASTPTRNTNQTVGSALNAYLNDHPTLTPTSGRIVR